MLHFRGCKCKKSNCLKKYCECFEAGVACGPNCRCFDCKNHVSTEHSRTPSQRSSEVSNPVVMQIANGSSRSYSHSSVPMRVPSTVGSGKRRRESSPVAIVSEDVGVQQRNAVDIDSKFPRVLEEQFFSHRFNHVNSTPGFKSLLQDVIDPEVVIMFCKKLVDVVKKEEMLNTVRSDKQAAEGLLFLASLNPEKEIATDSLRQNTRNELGNLQPDDDSLVCTEDYIDDNQSDETIDDEDLKQRSKELFQRQEALILLETDRFLKNLISMAQRRPQYRLERESNSLSLGSQNSAFRKAK